MLLKEKKLQINYKNYVFSLYFVFSRVYQNVISYFFIHVLDQNMDTTRLQRGDTRHKSWRECWTIFFPQSLKFIAIPLLYCIGRVILLRPGLKMITNKEEMGLVATFFFPYCISQCWFLLAQQFMLCDLNIKLLLYTRPCLPPSLIYTYTVNYT